jgi:hypothetical protein
MLEAIFGAGYDMQLVRDLWTILFTGWTMSEEKFLFAFAVLVIVPVLQEIRDRFVE